MDINTGINDTNKKLPVPVERTVPLEKAVLIGIDYGDTDECEKSLDELSRLAETAGAEAVAIIMQKRSEPHHSTYLGEGKIEEISEFCKQYNIDLIIADDEITGTQAKNLEKITDVRIIDRTMLILDIFAMRAESSQGRLQVELAQLKYRLPRLSGFGKSMSRIGGGGKGGIATRGPGETKLETDRRHINRRIHILQEQMKEAEQRRRISGKHREKTKTPTCALVGYTNAGKSTLMNALCGSDVYVEDKLFATLDPTIRKLELSDDAKKDVLLVDTVGFIRKLPHTLVESFKSTLDESLNADLLLHMVDCADIEAEKHIEIVEKLLADLEAAGKPLFLVLNKTDMADEMKKNSFEMQKKTHENAFFISAKTGDGLDVLKKAIVKFFDREREYVLLIPYCDGAILPFIYENAKITEMENLEEGTKLKVSADFKPEILSRVGKYIVK